MILDIPATTVPATGSGVFVNVQVEFDMPTDESYRRSILFYCVENRIWRRIY